MPDLYTNDPKFRKIGDNNAVKFDNNKDTTNPLETDLDYYN